ncbi:hypothetical protein GCM10010300_74160 [Streptomyces olivaceoviridis]|nr:hypothetical protein GCM10010300_74160 [Streptomyces olivaceoviridis]
MLILGLRPQQGAAAASDGAGLMPAGSPGPPRGGRASGRSRGARDRDTMAEHWKDDDQVDWLDSVSVDLIRGHGRLTDEK